MSLDCTYYMCHDLTSSTVLLKEDETGDGFFGDIRLVLDTDGLTLIFSGLFLLLSKTQY